MRNIFLVGLLASFISYPVQSFAYGWFGSPPPAPIEYMVSYAADPDVKNDQPIQLGYPNHIFSVMCSKKDCNLEVEIDGHKFNKKFPYVQQEWFRPDMKNRPYHTLDTIQSLPSYNGNSELKLGDDPKKNRDLVNVLEQNGWIAR